MKRIKLAYCRFDRRSPVRQTAASFVWCVYTVWTDRTPCPYLQWSWEHVSYLAACTPQGRGIHCLKKVPPGNPKVLYKFMHWGNSCSKDKYWVQTQKKPFALDNTTMSQVLLFARNTHQGHRWNSLLFPCVYNFSLCFFLSTTNNIF